MGVAGHGQGTQNNEFLISEQYFEKELRYEFDFLHEDKYQSFLQADTIAFSDHSQIFQVTKITSYQYLCNISSKEGGKKFIFCMQINVHFPSSKLILPFLVGWVRSVTPKVPKVTICKFFVISQEWSCVLIKLCNGNNLHMSMKDLCK